MDSASAKVKITIVVIAFLLIMCALVYGLWTLIDNSDNVIKTENLKEYTQTNISFTKLNPSQQFNYDDAIINFHTRITGIKDDILSEALTPKTNNLNLFIDDFAFNRISIPSLEINAPIISIADSQLALEKGFWLYPESIPSGEKVFMCYRRYWGNNHPFSCWYLDKLTIGSEIYIYNSKGVKILYKVASIKQVEPNDIALETISLNDIIKIITTSPLNTANNRLIIIAIKS